MGRDLHYVPGSYYQVDDRTGFPTRSERTKREWTGLQVDGRFWEARQPQDLVKGRPDNQTVPVPRPLAPNTFVGPIYLELGAAYGPGATTLAVNSLKGVSVGDKVAVMMDDGVNFQTVCSGLATGAIQISPALRGYTSAGNLVTVETEDISV